jgi:uncharacterized protein (TIGR03083 family)
VDLATATLDPDDLTVDEGAAVDDLRNHAAAERADLLALLEQLTPQQWDAASLCRGWRVRDVVAHVFSYDELSPADLARRFVRGRLNPNRVNAVCLAAYADRAPEQLVALARRCVQPRGLPAGFKGGIALVDGMIHQQDIRRPLGLPRVIPPDRLRAALEVAKTAPVILGFWHRRGLRMVAVDLDWSAGSGPEVRGPGEAVLLAIAGRNAAADQLTGPGLPTLRPRLDRASAA